MESFEYLVWPAPAVILIWLGTIFLIIFQKDISGLLARVKQISKGGIETFSPEPQQARERKSSSAEKLMRAFDNTSLRQQEERIKEDLEKENLSDQQEKIDVLIRHFAATQLAYNFEYINSLIWGSQIEIMRYLNPSIIGKTAEGLRPFYTRVAAMYPTLVTRYPFENYLNFLVSNNLIVQQGERYFITTLGLDFLGFLVNTGRTGFRGG